MDGNGGFHGDTERLGTDSIFLLVTRRLVTQLGYGKKGGQCSKALEIESNGITIFTE